MASFRDTKGTDWNIEIKIQQVEFVKKLCKDKFGNPVDLLIIIETGKLDQIIGDIELLVDIVFALCYEQIKEQFNVAEYDQDNADIYELIPEWKKESNIIKASRWFGNRFNGETLIKLVEAFQEALIDFFPNESHKAALRKIIAKSKELEQIQSEVLELQIEETFPIVTEKIREETKKKITLGLSGLLSGSTPE
ncbi:MAG: hypothetical protein LBK06_02765 [Planctomycetaceae bacterium]|jgi:hypothetical protein|nr:hypothetical protein [Planctomycetaceae bacterium]